MADFNDEMRPQRETTQGGKFQFDLRFLFLLMGLTAVVCGISKWSGNWAPAPLIVLIGALFWRTRRAEYAFFPGFGLGTAIALTILISFVSEVDFDSALFLAAYFGGLGASLNAVIQREYGGSGIAALVATVVYPVAIGAFSP